MRKPGQVQYMSLEHRRKLSEAKKTMWAAPGFKEHFFTYIQPRKSRVHSGGYWWCYLPNHAKANEHGYVIEQRAVAEEHLGRLLQDNEIVHHINHDKNDNRWENLQVVTHSQHAILHHRKPGPIKRMPWKVAQAIYQDAQSGTWSYHELSRRYNISYSMVYRIATGRSHKFVTGSDSSALRPGIAPKLSQEQVNILKHRYQQRGISQQALAQEFGISQAAVSMIVRGKRWSYEHHVPPSC